MIQNKVDPQTGEVVDQGTLDHLTGQLTAFGEFIQRVKRKFVKNPPPDGARVHFISVRQ